MRSTAYIVSQARLPTLSLAREPKDGGCAVIVAQWQSTGCTNQVSFPVTAGLFTFLYFTSKHLKSLSSYIVKCNGMPRSVSIGGVWNLL